MEIIYILAKQLRDLSLDPQILVKLRQRSTSYRMSMMKDGKQKQEDF